MATIATTNYTPGPYPQQNQNTTGQTRYLTQQFNSIKSTISNLNAQLATVNTSLSTAVQTWNGRSGPTVVPVSGDYSFSMISGIVASAQLPAPTASLIGGVKSASAPSNEWMTGIDTGGNPQFSQPGFSNLTGTVTFTQFGPVATASQIWANTASLIPSVNALWSANAFTTFSVANTMAANGANGLNFEMSGTLTANVAVTFSNLHNGASGIVLFVNSSGTSFSASFAITGGTAFTTGTNGALVTTLGAGLSAIFSYVSDGTNVWVMRAF